MALKLNGSTDGSVSIDAPADTSPTGTDVTLTLPTSAGSSGQYLQTNGSGGLSWAGAGKILQVVQGTTSTQVVVNTTTYTDSGLSASITPTSNTSKILVLINQEIFLGRSSSATYAGIRVYRDSTLIHDSVTDSTGPYDYTISAGGATSVALYTRAAFSILDSPGSTSSLTYKTQGRPYESSSSANITFNGSASAVNATSYIILLEVAA